MSSSPGQRVGTVRELRRYPLKSADGEGLPDAHVGTHGLDDDRRWAVTDEDGSVVGGKHAPQLHDVRAAVEDGLTVRLGDVLLRGDEITTALSTLLDRRVRVADAATGHHQVAAVHLVSTGAALADDAPGGCDPHPRANVVVDLAHPGDERHWLGRRVAVGDVVLRVTRTPSSCLGVYAEVVAPGHVRTGDVVRLLDATHGG